MNERSTACGNKNMRSYQPVETNKLNLDEIIYFGQHIEVFKSPSQVDNVLIEVKHKNICQIGLDNSNYGLHREKK